MDKSLTIPLSCQFGSYNLNCKSAIVPIWKTRYFLHRFLLSQRINFTPCVQENLHTLTKQSHFHLLLSPLDEGPLVPYYTGSIGMEHFRRRIKGEDRYLGALFFFSIKKATSDPPVVLRLYSLGVGTVFKLYFEDLWLFQLFMRSQSFV